jgi:hypothetical protein
MLEVIVELLIAIVCVLYISRRWAEAKVKRDVEESLRPGAGVSTNPKKPSVFWYLFK